MTVRGSLKTMAIADVFDWLARRGPVGELTLDRAGMTRRFQVGAGAVTGASSTNPAEYLGQVLLNSGAVSEEQLRDVYARQVSEGIALGKVLVLSGLATEQVLREALDLKVRESFYDALSWEDGTFQFDPARAPRPLEVELAVPIAALVSEGAERAVAWKKLRSEIPGDDVRFWVPDRSWVDKAKPGSPSALILGDILRGLSVREIVLARHAMPFPVYMRLSELMARGIVKVDRRAQPRDAAGDDLTPPQLIEAARGRAKGGDRAGALALARRALELAPASEAVKKAFHEIERALFAELSRTLLAKFRVPRLLKTREELAGAELSAEERYLVDRIDGRWDLLSLMRVAPLREVEALITFRRLADRGLIALE
jgi:hypothetical protein